MSAQVENRSYVLFMQYDPLLAYYLSYHIVHTFVCLPVCDAVHCGAQSLRVDVEG